MIFDDQQGSAHDNRETEAGFDLWACALGLCVQLCGMAAQEYMTPGSPSSGASRDGPYQGHQEGGQWEEDSFAAQASGAIPADVTMISGCKDEQTSADLANVSAIMNRPPPVGHTDAGGAFTSVFLATLQAYPQSTYIEMLDVIRHKLKDLGMTQVPELSSSKALPLDAPFVFQPSSPGRAKALLIGINYRGQQGELRGCTNDALKVQEMLLRSGFPADPSRMRVLADDGRAGHVPPTRANMLEAFHWLVADAWPGDALFLHYSGHGAQVPDPTGREASGQNDTIVPVDYQTAGMIIDDELLERLVLPLPRGCRLTALMDCCHSGTALDLPYIFRATEEALAGDPQMQQNPDFDLQAVLELARTVADAYRSGGLKAALVAGATSEAGQRVAAGVVHAVMAQAEHDGRLPPGLA